MAASTQLMRVRLQKGRHLVKRGEIWYLETCFDARQRRRSLGTSDFEEATRLAASGPGAETPSPEFHISKVDIAGSQGASWRLPVQVSGQLSSFMILLAIGRGKAHGYGIMREVERLSGGGLRMGPGTLYRRIGRLCSDGFVEETAKKQRPARHTRRKYYRLSDTGLAAARREGRLLSRLVTMAKAKRLTS